MVEFVFMLTRDDRTVEDCLDILDEVAPLGLRHVGFKDVGVGFPVLEELTRRIRAVGATSWLEAVTPDGPGSLASIETARRLGVDRIMGGVAAPEAMAALAGIEERYRPFPGRPEGHPTALGGSPDEIAADCRRFAELGCGGVDLLAYRAREADPIALVRAARAATEGELVVAGSIDCPERIAEIAAAGADAFTIGSAVFSGRFSPRKGSYLSQLRDVLETCASITDRRRSA